MKVAWIPRAFGTAFVLAVVLVAPAVRGQVGPATAERAAYRGLFAAAVNGDTAAIRSMLARGDRPDVRDAHQRTPLHVAAHLGQREAMRELIAGGADPNALERDRYDVVTIAAVANDLPTLVAALALGARATNITSRYDGTALIAAAHLGHAAIVRELARAGAPLDHVNNLGWTALIEAIVLGDGGPRHVDTLKVLLESGANPNIADRNGRTPLTLARGRGYLEMVRLLERVGARP